MPISSRAISHRGSRLGNKEQGFLCPGRDLCCRGSLLPSLLKAGSWEQPGFAGNFETALQLDKKIRAVVLCQAHFFFFVVGVFVLGFTVVFF